MMRLMVAGASGRMGRTLVRAVVEAEDLTLGGATERPGAPALGEDAGTLAGVAAQGVAITDDPRAALDGCDGILDFTSPPNSVALARLAAERGVVHVVGTTGFAAEDDAVFAEAAEAGAIIVKSGNMSLGVNLLAVLVRQAARARGTDCDIEVLEMHHRHKVDAPSGTALLLGEDAAAGRAVALDDAAIWAREGHTGARPEGAIGFATLRGGSVVGEHCVVFAGPDERIELGHRANDRRIFANGALAAARWARGKPAGHYSMRDVLGLAG
jgi:4-hydroxy-tetrahydrodipicolinate reductase